MLSIEKHQKGESEGKREKDMHRKRKERKEKRKIFIGRKVKMKMRAARDSGIESLYSERLRRESP